MNSILRTPDPNEVFSHPFRWAGSNLLFYALVASIAAGGFLVATALHSYFDPIQARPDIPLSQPQPAAPAIQPPTPASPTNLTPAKPSDEILISGFGRFQAEKIVGTQVNAQQKDKFVVGMVKEVLNADNGQTFAFIQLPMMPGSDVNYFILPTKRLVWKKNEDGSLA